MRIKVDFTVEVDPSIINLYMQDLEVTDESVSEFVRSLIIASGTGCLEEALHYAGFGFQRVEVVR